MSKPYRASIAVLAAVEQLGPCVTDEQLMEAIQYPSTAAVSNRLWWLNGRGFIRKTGKGDARRVYVTDEGKEFMAAPGPSSRPPAKDYGPPKHRCCLKCRKWFSSSWAGHRVCGKCKSTDVWHDGHGTDYPVRYG